MALVSSLNQVLRALEAEPLELSARSDASSLEAMLADEFVEFGRSGRCSAVGATACDLLRQRPPTLQTELPRRLRCRAVSADGQPALPLPREREALA